MKGNDDNFEASPRAQTMADELTTFETKLLKWLIKSDFHIQPWSSKDAAKAFKVKEAEIYEAVAALTKKVPEQIQVFYKDGSVHIAAD